jgi:hypothetical protein
MIANVTINFKYLGGSSLSGPITQLQNAITNNYFANVEIYNTKSLKAFDRNKGGQLINVAGSPPVVITEFTPNQPVNNKTNTGNGTSSNSTNNNVAAGSQKTKEVNADIKNNKNNSKKVSVKDPCPICPPVGYTLYENQDQGFVCVSYSELDEVFHSFWSSKVSGFFPCHSEIITSVEKNDAIKTRNQWKLDTKKPSDDLKYSFIRTCTAFPGCKALYQNQASRLNH